MTGAREARHPRPAASQKTSLVPKLLFRNALFRNSVSAAEGWESETEFRRADVPKQEFGNEGKGVAIKRANLFARRASLTSRGPWSLAPPDTAMRKRPPAPWKYPSSLLE